MLTIFKFFNLLQYCFCFMFCIFGCKAWGILAPQPGVEPTPLALEDKILIAGLPGDSWNGLCFKHHWLSDVWKLERGFHYSQWLGS